MKAKSIEVMFCNLAKYSLYQIAKATYYYYQMEFGSNVSRQRPCCRIAARARL